MKKYLSILMLAGLTLFAACSDDDNDKTVYTVTFETDGGTPVPSVQQVEEGNAVSAPSTNPTKSGYVFVYWHLSGATTAYNFQTPVNGNITLHAKWQEEAQAEYWQVTWNLNGGSWPADDNHAIQVLKGGTLPEPASPTKSGSAFEGWYNESALTNKITFPYNVSNVTSDIKLYAKWKIEGGVHSSVVKAEYTVPNTSELYNPTRSFYTLTWPAVPGCTEYNVYKSRFSIGIGYKTSLVTTTSDLTVTPTERFDLNMTYEIYYWVTAKTNSGETPRPDNGGIKVTYKVFEVGSSGVRRIIEQNPIK